MAFENKNHREMINRIDLYKSVIDTKRPLKGAELKELDEYSRIGLTYSSNALEGNTLTLSETKLIIEEGITVSGRPLKDCFEAVGHAKAYDWMLLLARSEALCITEEMLLQLHRLFYSGIDVSNAGVYRQHQVFITGTDYVPPTAEDVPAQMKAFVTELQEQQTKMHPIELAAFAHRRLVDIHPFVDGNGRTARLLMNLILVNRGYLVVSIPPILRLDYIHALQAAQRQQAPSDEAFLSLICSCELEAQKDFFRMFRMPLPDTNEKKI